MRNLRSRPDRRSAGSRLGFTLAEVAVTLVIVGLTLLLVMEGLNTSKITAAHSSNRKIALDLALLVIGRVESGAFWEKLDGLPGTQMGSFAEEGYEAFQWELVIGDEELSDYHEDDSPYFDNRRYEIMRQREEEDYEEQEPYAETGSTGGPYEIVKVRVTFPQLGEASNEVIVERWVPLEQVFGHGDGYSPSSGDPFGDSLGGER